MSYIVDVCILVASISSKRDFSFFWSIRISFSFRRGHEGKISQNFSVSEQNNVPLENKMISDFQQLKLKQLGVTLRQTWGFRSAGQRASQLSRVSGVLKENVPQLTTRVKDCMLAWQKMCTFNFLNFHAGADALALLVDEFRIVTILSNGWSYALAHGDYTRMSETEIHLVANHKANTLEISIVNASREDEQPFEKFDVSTFDIVDNDYRTFGKSARPAPSAKLTSHMGLKRMNKLCSGRLSLKSKGWGGKTTLTCIIDADYSALYDVAIKSFKESHKNEKALVA